MAINDRVCVNSNFGTVRYSGEIAGKTGTWLGIEWDDLSRGKGDGSVDGVRYFQSSSSTGASFLRSTAPSLVRGRSFVAALRDKYIEEKHEENGVESITLGSSDGAIEVEAVNMNKVRNKFARLDNLKEVGLENYMVSLAGSPGEISQTSPNIRRLDLSRNLISSWVEVLFIARELIHLESLTLNHCRLQPLASALQPGSTSVKELRLNYTYASWEQSLLIAPGFPSLKSLEIGYNNITEIKNLGLDVSTLGLPSLEALSFDGNAITNWNSLVASVTVFPSIRTLLASENQIDRIDLPAPLEQALPNVNSISLDGNRIPDWKSVDALSSWLPNLQIFRMQETPLMSDPSTAKYARQLLIGHIRSLTRLNSSTVSQEERQDAEIFYLGWIARNVSTELRASEHPRWEELTKVYGEPGDERPSQGPSKFQNRLIAVDVYQISNKTELPTEAPLIGNLSLLPNMPLKTFRLKLIKLLKLRPTAKLRVYVWLKSEQRAQGSWGEIEFNSARQPDLEWWGIEQGSILGVIIDS